MYILMYLKRLFVYTWILNVFSIRITNFLLMNILNSFSYENLFITKSLGSSSNRIRGIFFLNKISYNLPLVGAGAFFFLADAVSICFYYPSGYDSDLGSFFLNLDMSYCGYCSVAVFKGFLVRCPACKISKTLLSVIYHCPGVLRMAPKLSIVYYI